MRLDVPRVTPSDPGARSRIRPKYKALLLDALILIVVVLLAIGLFA